MRSLRILSRSGRGLAQRSDAAQRLLAFLEDLIVMVGHDGAMVRVKSECLREKFAHRAATDGYASFFVIKFRTTAVDDDPSDRLRVVSVEKFSRCTRIWYRLISICLLPYQLAN
jgi:hypothetical protein